MNSLQELNGFGSSSLEVTDTRPAGIKYTPAPPAAPFTQILNINSTTVNVNAGIDITEIINYSTANVRYRVTIIPGTVDPLVSSVSWASLPTGVTLNTAGNTYTLSGINTVAQWQAVKNFIWNLPGNYASKPFWYLQVSVLYYDEATASERSVDWEAYDNRFYFVAQLNASSSVFCDAKDVILGQAFISSAFTPTLNFIRVKRFQAGLVAEASVSGDGQINAENFVAETSLTAQISYQTRGQSIQSSTSNLNASGIILISNMFDRNYIANNKNILFASDIPQIQDDDPSTTAMFTVTFSSSIGKFSINPQIAAITPYSYSGTLAQVNAIFSQILFYPNPGVSSNGSFTYTQQKNAVTQVTRTVNLTGNAGTFVGNLYTFNNNALWTPTFEDITYGVADILLVGGGGGGACLGGGGGGNVVSFTGSTSLNSLTTRTITIGSGGVAGAIRPTGSTATFNGGAGGTTSISGFASAGGGIGGKNEYITSSNIIYDGGSSGSGNAGGAGNSGTETLGGITYAWRVGGGGGGNSSNGAAGSISAGGAGGAGTGNIISGSFQIYGVGGKGALLRSATNFGEAGVPGQANRGNGGGGGSGFQSGAGTQSGNPIEQPAAPGGSGVVFIRFRA
jgi:hypothetical protein